MSSGRIAVIGGGVAGIVSCYLLSRRFSVTLFEANSYVGGHTNTVTINSGPDRGLQVDTGFIVCNDKTYPLFQRFLEQLNVPVRYSDMSFGYYDEATEFCYAGTSLGGLFARPRNLIDPEFYRML
ncbi:MAG: NAD(P)-binding protein, partial [Bdellovibrionales bacterium]|nr:NAD(P)-binding protein [Bdellovibrionales bacterium]